MTTSELLLEVEHIFPFVVKPQGLDLSFHKDECYHCGYLRDDLAAITGQELPRAALRNIHREMTCLSAAGWRWALPSYLRHCLAVTDNRDDSETEFLIYNFGPAPEHQSETRQHFALLIDEQIVCLIHFLEWWMSIHIGLSTAMKISRERWLSCVLRGLPLSLRGPCPLNQIRPLMSNVKPFESKSPVSRLRSVVERFWPSVYWLVFACFAAIGLTDPGHTPKSMPLPPYPVHALAVIWVVFAATTWWLCRLVSLVKGRFTIVWLIQVILFMMLMVFFILTAASSGSGDEGAVIALFGLLGFIMLLAHALALGFKAAFSKFGFRDDSNS